MIVKVRYKFKIESKIYWKKVKINVNIKIIEVYSWNKYMYILYMIILIKR